MASDPDTAREIGDEATLAGATLPGSGDGAGARTQPWTLGREADPGARLGRYLLLSKLGAGGMGVVYAAYDDKLDRKVALKLLWSRGKDMDHSRLVREAQAMARLSHPNVVQIYEIHEGGSGSAGGSGEPTFLVMEYVDGVTLRDWRSERERGRAEILEVFTAAGRGLAAAHDKDLVHRDFKPDNVMIARDGRVLVMDFGLARDHTVGDGPSQASAGAVSEAPLNLEISTSKGLSVDLTQTGALMGTPAYMSPEQFAGKRGDALSDQFSFCVALWEALHGQRPFAGASLPALTLAVTKAELREPSGGDVPGWIHAVLVRGLAGAPADRWPSMAALLDALTHDPTKKRRTRVVAALAGAAMLAGIAGVYVTRAQAEAALEASCERESRAIEDDWSGEVEAALQATFAASELGFAATSWAQTQPQIQAYAARWTTLRREVCLEAGREDAADADETRACFEERRAVFAGLLEAWSRPTEAMITRAPMTAGMLEDPASCLDAQTRARRPAPGEVATRERVQALRVRLERVAAYGLADGGAKAIGFSVRQDEARDLLEEAHALGWRPLIAEALLVLGGQQHDAGDYEPARASFEQAFFVALAEGHDSVALRAASGLVQVIGFELAERESGEHWAQLSTSLVERTGLATSLDEARLVDALANFHWRYGDYDESLRQYTRAVELYTATLGPKHPRVARMLAERGYVRKDKGDYAGALEDLRQAREVLVGVFGPGYPNVIYVDDVEAKVRGDMGEIEAAIALQRSVLARYEAGFGPEHHLIADVTMALGSSLAELGEYEEALALELRSRRISEAKVGPDHPSVAVALNNLAIIYAKLERREEALTSLRRALAINERIEPNHPNVGAAYNNIGTVLRELERWTEAVAALEQARRIFETALGPEHPHLVYPLIGLGEAYLALGEYGQARAALDRAVVIADASEGASDWQRAVVAVLLARAEAEGAPLTGAARAQAEQTLALLREQSGRATEAAMVARWLDEGAATAP